MAQRERDPLKGFKFRMEIEGVEVAGFKEITGIETKIGVIDYAEGDDVNQKVRKLTGRQNYTNVVFKRGIVTDGAPLWEWYNSVSDYGREFERKAVTIAVIADDSSDADKKIYTFIEAWPCRYKGPSLDALVDAVAVEEIEFAYEKLEVETA